jgi:hypothetical protein
MKPHDQTPEIRVRDTDVGLWLERVRVSSYVPPRCSEAGVERSRCLIAALAWQDAALLRYRCQFLLAWYPYAVDQKSKCCVVVQTWVRVRHDCR